MPVDAAGQKGEDTEDFSDLLDLFEEDDASEEQVDEQEESTGLFDQKDSEESEETSEDTQEDETSTEEQTEPEPEPEPEGEPTQEGEQESREDYRKRQEHLESITERLAAIQEQSEKRRQQEEKERQEKARQEAEERSQQERNKPLYTEEQLDLTEEERKAYQDALPVLNKVARSAAQDVHDRSVRPLQEEVERLRNHTQTLDQSQSQTRADSFVSAIRGMVPDLDQRTGSQGWENYMSEQVSVPGQGRMTRAEAVRLATQNSDLDYVVDQIKGFRLDNGQEQEKPQGARSPGNGQASAKSAQPKPARSKVVSYSKSMQQLEGMAQKVRNGRMSLDKYEKAADKFEEEMANGNVDMDS